MAAIKRVFSPLLYRGERDLLCRQFLFFDTLLVRREVERVSQLKIKRYETKRKTTQKTMLIFVPLYLKSVWIQGVVHVIFSSVSWQP